MFRLSYTTPQEGPVETLRFKYDPRGNPFGNHTDVNGKKWHCNGIMYGRLLAREFVDDYWTSTADGWCGLQSASWKCYDVEVVE